MRYVRHLPHNKTLHTEEEVLSLGLTEELYPVNEVLLQLQLVKIK